MDRHIWRKRPCLCIFHPPLSCVGNAGFPQSWEEYVALAANTALDFIPGGKALKLFKGASAKLGLAKLNKLLAKQAKKKAGKAAGNIIPKGFKQTKKFGYSHGQKVYEYKGKYYSRDVDSHKGGIWKVFEEVGGKLKRIGTADENLNILKR